MKKKRFRELEEQVYSQLIIREIAFWRRLNEPVALEDFEFMIERRGFQRRHITKLIDQLAKYGLAEHIGSLRAGRG